ncbi:MAG: peptidoglycan DD-metalloendopeptidase family protein [Lactobacillus sp.]|jgi:murein DD-endopeptidase MepM/ murein hydrolase activator NlpD|nr:peptidoglycan DD-metalloendopeptidase family protein [Lactobacillus sp.]
MKKILKETNKVINTPLCIKEKTPLFSPKEIIFRSGGRAKVFTFSSQFQVIALCLLLLVAASSFYSYHMYNRSGNIISKKDMEIVATKDAYVELISNMKLLHSNIDNMMKSSDKSTSPQVEEYKKQAELLSEKIKEVTETQTWVDLEQMNEKISINEALLQRDILSSERDELRTHIAKMEEAMEALKEAEMEVYEKISSVTSKEIDKIKSTLSTINEPLKKKGLYFNALSNKKSKAGKGGPYIPNDKQNPKNEKLNQHISVIFDNVDDLEYYKEVMQYVPVGKPVWSYWVSSPFGVRPDPFHAKEARHKGVDLASRTGNKIKSMAKGRVTRAEYAGAYGNLVEVDHGNGFRTKYAHLHKIYVKKGDYLKIDDTIGEVGSTGRSTGPHLHYEILFRGVNVDPMPFIKAKS